MLDVNYRRFIVIVLATVGFTGFFTSFGVFYHLETTSPAKPIAAAGQIYQLNDHGHLFYVIHEQYWLSLLCIRRSPTENFTSEPIKYFDFRARN